MYVSPIKSYPVVQRATIILLRLSFQIFVVFSFLRFTKAPTSSHLNIKRSTYLPPQSCVSQRFMSVLPFYDLQAMRSCTVDNDPPFLTSISFSSCCSNCPRLLGSEAKALMSVTRVQSHSRMITCTRVTGLSRAYRF